MNAEVGRCRPAPERALCVVDGCTYADPAGEMASGGRDQLRAHLREPSDSAGCSCNRCSDHPLTAAEVAGVLTHVSDRLAVLLFLGEVAPTIGMVGCEVCDGWVLGFVPSASADPGVLAHTGCPYHRL